MSDGVRTFLRDQLSMLWAPKRLGQFAGVGVVGASVDIATLFLLVSLTPIGPIAGKVVAWTFGIGVIFAINEYWTFADFGVGTPRAVLRRMLRSYAVRFAGFLVTLTVLAILVYWFDVWYLAANVAGIAVGFFVNYAAESLYTWRVHHTRR